MNKKEDRKRDDRLKPNAGSIPIKCKCIKQTQQLKIKRLTDWIKKDPNTCYV